MTNFKILTPAFNCQEEIETTLYSVIGQTYKNWQMILIDDMSTDTTGDVVKDIADRNNLSEKIKVVRREEKFGEVRNTIEEVQKLNDDDVVIRLDAGDWITDLGCLQYLNSIYEKYDPAVLWTSQRWAYTDHSICGPIDLNVSLYDQPWKSSHLKTFRVKDFMGLNPRNFKDDLGNYIMIGCDQAIFLPMMERARRNRRPLIYFPRVMYHYSIDLKNPDLFTNERSLEQKYSAEWIRKRGYIE